MKRIAIGLALALSAVGLQAGEQQVMPELVEVEDADTLRVELAGVSYRIQLPGVDAPESVSNPKLLRDVQRTGLDADTLLALGRQADLGLRGQLDGFMPYRLQFDPQERDKYGRVPGDFSNAAGQRLSVRLVETGYAIPAGSLEPAQQAELQAAMVRARDERRGLWGSHPESFAAWAHPLAGAPAR